MSGDSPVRDTAGRSPLDLTGIDWLIVGGESGGRFARPMHPTWARELRNACLDGRQVGNPWQFVGPDYEPPKRPAFFFKQHGSWTPHIGHVHRQDAEKLYVFPDGPEPPEPWNGSRDGAVTSWDETATTGDGRLLIRYAGAGPKSGGRLLDGREWNEMPG